MQNRIIVVQDVKNDIEIKHKNYKVDRRLDARKENYQLAAGGVLAAGAMEFFNWVSQELLGAPMLDGWSLGTIALFILIILANIAFRRFWWKGNDAIYESEKS